MARIRSNELATVRCRNIKLRARFFVHRDGTVVKRARPLPHDSPLRSAILKRDRGQCVHCGRGVVIGLDGRRLGYDDPRWGLRVEIDHLVPRCRGGQNTPDNLALACFDCNRRKHARVA